MRRDLHSIRPRLKLSYFWLGARGTVSSDAQCLKTTLEGLVLKMAGQYFVTDELAEQACLWQVSVVGTADHKLAGLSLEREHRASCFAVMLEGTDHSFFHEGYSSECKTCLGRHPGECAVLLIQSGEELETSQLSCRLHANKCVKCQEVASKGLKQRYRRCLSNRQI